MRVVVSGAGGFVGGWLARDFVVRGYEVVAIYRNHLADETRNTPGIHLVQGDLTTGVVLPDRFDAVVHCAADIPGLCPDEGKLTHSNVAGTHNLLRRACEGGAASFVNLSSMSFYGRISVPVVTEDLVPVAPDAYGRSKAEAEALVAEACTSGALPGGLSIRLPGTVGRGSHHNFLSSVLAKVFSGEPIRANHPYAPFNNIVFVGHLCAFIDHWLRQGRAGYFVTNIAARDTLPVREVLGLLYERAGRPENITWTDEGKAPFLIDVSNARALGYGAPTVGESLKAFVDDCLGTGESQQTP